MSPLLKTTTSATSPKRALPIFSFNTASTVRAAQPLPEPKVATPQDRLVHTSPRKNTVSGAESRPWSNPSSPLTLQVALAFIRQKEGQVWELLDRIFPQLGAGPQLALAGATPVSGGASWIRGVSLVFQEASSNSFCRWLSIDIEAWSCRIAF